MTLNFKPAEGWRRRFAAVGIDVEGAQHAGARSILPRVNAAFMRAGVMFSLARFADRSSTQLTVGVGA